MSNAKDPFEGLTSEIQRILEECRMYYWPDPKTFEKEKLIAMQLIPRYRENMEMMGKEYLLKELAKYKAGSAEGYDEISNSFHWKLPRNHWQRKGVENDKFIYAVNYKIHDLFIKAIEGMDTPEPPEPGKAEKPENVENSTHEVQPPILKTYTGKIYALSVMCDLLAAGEVSKIAGYKRKEFQEDFTKRRRNDDQNGSSIYSRFNEIRNKRGDYNSVSFYEDIAGREWYDILIELSNKPEALKAYFKQKKMHENK